MEFFADFLLIHFQDHRALEATRYEFDPKYIAEILGENELKDYWIKNREKVIAATKDIKKTVDARNYKVSYDEHLPFVFDALDEYSRPVSPTGTQDDDRSSELKDLSSEVDVEALERAQDIEDIDEGTE